MKKKIITCLVLGMSILPLRAAIVNGTCGENLTWTINTRDSTLIIEGSGKMEKQISWYGYSSYVREITLPEDVTWIYWDGITGCSNLNKLVWNIRNYSGTFSINFLTRIKYMVFGENVSYIPNNLCKGMTKLKSIVCYASTPPTMGTTVFQDVPRSVIPLFVPEGSIDAYSNAMWWEEFPIRPIGYCIVKFIDWDGTILSSNYIKEGQTATAPTTQSRVGYTFIGWDKPYNNVTEDMTITALYRLNKYFVKFIDWDGQILKSDSVNFGSPAIAPNPSRQGYTFTGWDKDFSNIIGDLNVTAKYLINKYKVEFVDWNGNVLQSDSITYGEPIIAPQKPQREGYTFIGWDKTFTVAQENIKIIAQYKINRFLIKFVDWDETVLKSDSVNYRYSAFAPTNPTRHGYKFIGWDKDFSCITTDLKITAKYELAGYTVTFLDYNSAVLSEQFVEENESAVEPVVPHREGYNFIGWNIEYDHITAPTFVIAIYEKVETDIVLVVFKDDLNNIVSSQNVVCTIPTAPIRDKQFLGWYIGGSLLEDTIVVQAKYEGEQGCSTPHTTKQVVRKEIREGKVYVVRGDKTYTLQGQDVK